MRVFSIITVIERKMFTAENLNSPTQTGEHCHPSNIFVCVPHPVTFVVAIIVGRFFCANLNSQ